MNYSKIVRAVIMSAFIGCVSLSAQATNKTATFLVSLTVSSDCSISANALPFGTATSALATSPINQTTTLSVTCSNGTSYTLSLDKGTTTGSTVTARLLAGTGSNVQTVQYQLYSDSGRSTIWGDTSGGSTVSGTGSGSAQSITIYGQVPAQTIPTADNYSSTETATITF
ncbi:MAG: spore coat U domain-containing protein [Nevskia sp.]|nr:spore coat U domain-containing protein [Nevskia sp.]